MSRAVSPSSNRAYGVAMVSRMWRVARATVYRHRRPAVASRRPGPRGPMPDDLREISPDDARELFPALTTVLKALYFRGGARVDGRLLTAALMTAAKPRGLTERSDRAESLVIEGGRVTK